MAEHSTLKETLSRFGQTPIVRVLREDRLGLIGATVIAAMVLVALFAPWVAPYDPTAMSPHRLTSPNQVFLLGADEAGRDLLSRAIYGARTSLFVSITVATLSGIVGTALGLLAGYYRKALDAITMRIMDVLFAFPTILLALGVVAALGPDTRNMILALSVVFVPAFARIVRGTTLSISREPYVEAARAAGIRNRRILWKYILPNTTTPIAVQFTVTLALVILVEAALSYLGLGVQPPTPAWGAMLSSGQQYMQLSIWLSLIPGAFIMLTVLGFNLLGDALRDSLDPRLRSSARKIKPSN